MVWLLDHGFLGHELHPDAFVTGFATARIATAIDNLRDIRMVPSARRCCAPDATNYLVAVTVTVFDSTSMPVLTSVRFNCTVYLPGLVRLKLSPRSNLSVKL